MSVYRNSSDESRKFWEGVDQSAAEVANWPDWKIDHPRAQCDGDSKSSSEGVGSDAELR